MLLRAVRAGLPIASSGGTSERLERDLDRVQRALKILDPSLEIVELDFASKANKIFHEAPLGTVFFLVAVSTRFTRCTASAVIEG
jgi:hypothetical protein